MDTNLDLNTVCLTCMCVSARTLSVFTKDLKYGLTLMAMITNVSSNTVVPCDGLPTKLCYSCAECLRIAFAYQQTCISSYKTLLTYVEQGNSEDEIKVEESSVLLEATAEAENVQDCTEEKLDNIMDASVSDYSNQLLENGSPEESNKEPLYSNEEYLDEILSDMEEMEDNDSQNVEIEQLDDSGGSFAEDDNNHMTETITLKKDTKPTPKKHQCTVCNRVLSKFNHLKRHMLTHSRSKPFQCTVCPKSFNRSDNLYSHIMNHSSERPFSCNVCKKSFKRDEHLKNHLVRRHKTSDQIDAARVCSICNRYFAVEANLTKHMEMHSQEKEFVCEDCGKRFSNKYQYTAHCRTHNEVLQKSFLCTHCGKRFSRKDYLTVHMRRHTGENPFKCNYCEKAFPRMTDLKVHENYHTNKKNHHCSLCGKSFFRLCSLRLHMKIHTGEKPYGCPHCPKQFIQSYDLQTHIRRHTGERFQCELCEEKFIHSHQLKQHAKAAHSAKIEGRVRNLDKVIDTPEQQSHKQTT